MYSKCPRPKVTTAKYYFCDILAIWYMFDQNYCALRVNIFVCDLKEAILNLRQNLLTRVRVSYFKSQIKNINET